MFSFQYFNATAVGVVAPTLAEGQGTCFEGRSTVASPIASLKLMSMTKPLPSTLRLYYGTAAQSPSTNVGRPWLTILPTAEPVASRTLPARCMRGIGSRALRSPPAARARPSVHLCTATSLEEAPAREMTRTVISAPDPDTDGGPRWSAAGSPSVPLGYSP